MIRLRVHDFSGLELDWIASDLDGCVALLASAGFGAVPEPLPAADGSDTALDLVRRLSITGDAISSDDAAILDDWRSVAQRGCYAFDWSHARDRNERVAAPSAPLRVEALQLESLRVTARRWLVSVRFADVRWLAWDDRGTLTWG